MTGIFSLDRRRPILAPAGSRIYAVGDIHGRKDLLDRLLTLIRRDAQLSRAHRRLVVFLGDTIDRGPDSAAVVETLRAGPPPLPAWSGFRWICLRGNHEDAMLAFLDDPAIGPNWMANGGLATIRDYVTRARRRAAPAPGAPFPPPALPPPADLDGLRELFRRAVPPAHHAFLSSLPLSHCEGDYYFVHAGVRPGVPLDRQRPADQMWIREGFLDSPADYGKLVVHGHTIAPAPEVRRNRIGIDTGAYQSGQLTALVAEGSQFSFLST